MRLAFLALTETKDRPRQIRDNKSNRHSNSICSFTDTFRYYDAVGPETMTITEMLGKFAKAQGNNHFRPVNIGYRNMERVLNIKSLGNLNRQFVSLLRSEQDAKFPIIGDAQIWDGLLGPEGRMITLDEAFSSNEESLKCSKVRRFPYLDTLQWALRNPKVIPPGIELSLEILMSYFFNVRDS